MKFYDLCIIGSGPAGCMAAISAKRINPDASITVIAPDDAPYRIGEALLTGTVYTMQAAGIDDMIASMNYHQKIGAAYVWGETREPWYVDYPEVDEDWPSAFSKDGLKTSIHVPRDVFDKQLKDIAMSMGVLFIDDKPTEARIKPNGRVMNLSLSNGDKVFSRYFIDATGQSAWLAKQVTKRHRVWNPRVARYGHTSQVDWEKATMAGFDKHRTNIISHEKGWFWVIDLGERGTSVGFVLDSDSAKFLMPSNAHMYFPELESFGLVGMPGLKSPEGKPMDKFIGHPDWSYLCDELNGENWAAVGDAALFLDPILSQGVTLAMHYGFMRGAASMANDPKLANDQVSKHYMNESLVLKRIIEQWYSNNRSVSGWHELTSEIDSVQRESFESFQSLTNLEGLKDAYAPFNSETQSHIESKLGVRKQSHDQIYRRRKRTCRFLHHLR